MRDLDIALLRTFIAVLDAGGFTRAAERIHRTQSTISQQIRRLEEQVGATLLERTAHAVTLTDDGERLEGYARRILALNDAARDALSPRRRVEVVRLGLTEDFAQERLPHLLAQLADDAALQLQVSCDLSATLRTNLQNGDLDLALVKQLDPPTEAMASARFALHWVGDGRLTVDPDASVPLAVFPHGCVYRNHAIHVLEAAGRPWHVAYASPNLSGIRAAVQAGLGVSPLARWEMTQGLTALPADHGLPALPDAYVALHVARDLKPGATRIARLLADSLGPAMDGDGGTAPMPAVSEERSSP